MKSSTTASVIATALVVSTLVVIHLHGQSLNRPLIPSIHPRAPQTLPSDSASLIPDKSAPQLATTSPLATTQPAIVAPRSAPAFVLVNTATAITFTVTITDPTPLPNGVNLLQVSGSGQQTIVGQMHGDGTNDGIFTLQTVLNEQAAGSANFQVSAAFAGLLKRSLSPMYMLPVWTTFSDTASGIHFSFPLFAQTLQVVNNTVNTSTELSDIDINIMNAIEQAYTPLIGIQVFTNLPGTTLQQWFSQNIDDQEFLASAATFQQQQLSNGVTALVQVGPVPDAYLTQDGPVADVYAISPNGTKIIVLTGGQEAQVSEFGYDKRSLYVQMLGAASFH
jgi:hypothetical protein